MGAFTEYGISPKLYAPSLKKIPRYSFRVFDQIDISVRETIEKKEQEKSYKYISFNDLYKITEQVIFDDCLIWRDADHFSTCGEKHIAQNADWAVLLPLITNE